MPSPSYRRRLRQPNAVFPLTNLYLEGAPAASRIRDCELQKMYDFFYKALDLIIQQFSLTEAVSSLHDILDKVNTKVDYYNLLEHIENNLLSIVQNITSGTSIGVIVSRVEYIKKFIDALPPSCQDLGPISTMIMELLDVIIGANDFTTIKNKITTLQNTITTTFPNMNLIVQIQEALCDIISNISDGSPSNIIEFRINYVRSLIAQI